MKRISWSLLRSQLEPELELELRVCIELLWVLPAPGSAPPVLLLPSNVLVGADGTVVLGSPPAGESGEYQRYLAPELQAGARATLASATYAVGALLFEAVSRRCFESTEAVEHELWSRSARATATGSSRDRAATELLRIVLKATQRSPLKRWRTPERLSRELDRVARPHIATREELAQRVERLVSCEPRSSVSSPVYLPGFQQSPTPGIALPAAVNSHSSTKRLQPHQAVAADIQPQLAKDQRANRTNRSAAFAALTTTLTLAIALSLTVLVKWHFPTPHVMPARTLSEDKPVAKQAAPTPPARSRPAAVRSAASELTSATATPCTGPSRAEPTGPDGGESSAGVEPAVAVPSRQPHQYSTRSTQSSEPDYGI